MNDILRFDYYDSEIRVIKDEEGNPWWVASDVCSILGLTNPREAVARLDDDEKNTVRISDGINDNGHGVPGNPNLNIINEPGLYTLIIRSNKPEAKVFKRWITHEVLPSLRKNGCYVMAGMNQGPLSLKTLGENLYAAKGIARVLGLKGNRAILAANHAVKKYFGYDCFAVMDIEPPDPEPEEEVLPGMVSGKMVDDFLADCCEEDEGAFEGASEIYDAFKRWYAMKKGEFVPSQKAFGRVMARKFARVTRSGYVKYHGVKLKRLAKAATN